jgi:hypothetical protein
MNMPMRNLASYGLRAISLPILALIAAALVGCASGGTRPVFYPNAHLESVGMEWAQRDVDECMALARRYGVNQTKDGEVGQKAAKGGVLGGVGAGVWGLIRGGDALERAAAGAAAGAATGATAGAFESAELSPTFKSFVHRCLSERGYEVIGWE